MSRVAGGVEGCVGGGFFDDVLHFGPDGAARRVGTCEAQRRAP